MLDTMLSELRLKVSTTCSTEHETGKSTPSKNRSLLRRLNSTDLPTLGQEIRQEGRNRLEDVNGGGFFLADFLAGLPR